MINDNIHIHVPQSGAVRKFKFAVQSILAKHEGMWKTC